MTTRRGEPATAVGRDHKDTEVGSVFVSNYPPYSFWTPDAVADATAALDAAPRSDTSVGLYFHVPFCRRRCKFCYFKVYTDKNAQEVARYVRALGTEAASLAERPAVRGRDFNLIYVGGGTPSYISSRHLREVFERLRDSLPLERVQEVTFECEPGTLTESKLDAIREVGVTRLSLGVENFDDAILRDNGRAHVTKEIDRVLPWIQALDFAQFNIDLISGMVGETWETWKRSISRAIECDPDSVTIYQMELPYNTVYSKEVLSGGDVGIADWKTKREWHDYAIEALAAAGYEVSSAYTMVKRGSGASFLYRDALWRGNDLLGIGVSSFGHVGGVHYQNTASWERYLERVEAGDSPIERGYATDAGERLVRETILQLKLGVLDVEALRERHGVDVRERFAAVWTSLRDDGWLEPDDGDGGIRLTRQGLLRVDTLLPRFYDARFQNARYT